MKLTLTQKEIEFLSALLENTGADEITYAQLENGSEVYTIHWSSNGVASRSTFDRGLIALYNYNAFRFACEVI